ncbi:MAG: sulfotransferase [Isosphaeraceae bacterium]|nr:sulfotransferase [Isosphaeraceae bacterium]
MSHQSNTLRPESRAPRSQALVMLRDKLHRLADRDWERSRRRHCETACRLILLLDPADLVALFRLGVIRHEAGDFGSAIHHLGRLVQRDPDCAKARISLGRAYWALGEHEEAKECFRAALQLEPGSVKALVALGAVERLTNEIDAAIASFREAAARDPQSCEALVSLGAALLDDGKRGEAIACLEQAAEIASDSPEPYRLLVDARYYTRGDHPHLGRLERLLQERKVPAGERRNLHFALGELYDQLGLWDQAFLHFRAGNELVEHRYNRRQLARYTDARIRAFTKEVIASIRERSPETNGANLIFVVGMPRSGTSLVEQILSSLPDVHGGGETLELPGLVGRLPSLLGTKEAYPRCLARIDRAAIGRISDDYLSRISRLSDGASRFVDKMPGNCWELGLITAVFPGAKIIHCKRNALDTCLSCYFQNFKDLPFAYDLGDLVDYHHHYSRIVAHWRDVLPTPVLDLQYEDLVESPEQMIRALLEYCDLPWDPRCLEFYRTRRMVRTASRWQVKRPLYSTSVGRWRNYERHIKVLVEAIGGGPA